jgi:hypothetical protein
VIVPAALALATLAPSATTAADAPSAAVPDAPAAAPERLVLAAGTEVRLANGLELHSLTARQGQIFPLTVAADVRVGPYLVIPRGSPATGQIARVGEKGMFGRSGKLDLTVLYVEVGGRRIRLTGQTRRKGTPGTAPVIVTAILVGEWAGFISGTSAVVPVGAELSAFVLEDIPLAVAKGPSPPSE